MDKPDQVLQYMLRPRIEDCLDLWFGKSAQTDRDIRERFGADVALAAGGFYAPWALDAERPRRLVALVILLDQFPRNMYRDTARMYDCDAHCRGLVRRALRAGMAERLRPIERVFLCLVLTHSEALCDQQLCMEEWGRVMAELAADDPLHVFHDIFQRHLAVVERFGRFPHRNALLQRANTAAEQGFLGDSRFRFDLPLVRQPNGAFAFAGTCGQSPGYGSSPATSASAASSVSDRPCRTRVATCSDPRAALAAVNTRARPTSSSGSNFMLRAS
jgi:uncharacterized protein (DUF924 family)